MTTSQKIKEVIIKNLITISETKGPCFSEMDGVVVLSQKFCSRCPIKDRCSKLLYTIKNPDTINNLKSEAASKWLNKQSSKQQLMEILL